MKLKRFEIFNQIKTTVIYKVSSARNHTPYSIHYWSIDKVTINFAKVLFKKDKETIFSKQPKKTKYSVVFRLSQAKPPFFW